LKLTIKPLYSAQGLDANLVLCQSYILVPCIVYFLTDNERVAPFRTII